MKNARLIFTALLLLGASLFSSPALAGDFVGNSGDGVWVGGRLILRDLLQAGLTDSFYLGPSRNPRLRARLADLPPALIDAADPLLRKLSDLDAAIPNLADYLAAGLTTYSFTFVDQPLEKEPLEGGVISFPEKDRVQLATRVFSTIYLHAPSWAALSPENKAALLLHEMVASLLLPEPSAGGFEKQSSLRAREILGAFFSPELKRRGAAFLLSAVRKDLAISSLALQSGYHSNRWILTFATYQPERSPLKRVIFVPEIDAPESARARGYELCEEVARKESDEPYFFRLLTSMVSFSSWKPAFVEYATPYGKQLRLEIRNGLVKPADDRQLNNSTTVEGCRAMIDAQLPLFYANTPAANEPR